jgi:hypothetical protein
MIMTKSKKTLWNYFETISSSKRVLSKRRETEKNEEKTKPYLKLIHLLRQCIENVMECCMFFTANRLSRDYIDLVTSIEITAEKAQMPVQLKVTNLKPITELRK